MKRQQLPARTLGGRRPVEGPLALATDLPSVSVLIVVRNGASTLRDAVDSVVSQNYPNLELIVVDGCSTDETVDILAGYGTKIELWISEPDLGIFDAMNKAVRLARSDWVLFLGSDDRLVGRMANIATYLKQRDTIYYGNVWIPGRGVTYDGPFDAWKLLKRNICHQAILYPRSTFERHQFTLTYPALADWELNLRCFKDPECHFEYIPELIAEYNGTTGLSARIWDRAFALDHSTLIRETLPTVVYLWHMMKAPLRCFHAVRRNARRDPS